MEEKFIIFGIQNDELNQKLLGILEDAEVNFEFRDYRNFPPTPQQLSRWAEFEGEDFPINGRSSFFKKNKKHFIKLDDAEKYQWLSKNYHAILKPIIEDDSENVLSIGGRPERLAVQVFNLEKDLF